MEHPNAYDGGGRADEVGKDEEEDVELIDEENMHNVDKPPNPTTSSKAKNAKPAFGLHMNS